MTDRIGCRGEPQGYSIHSASGAGLFYSYTLGGGAYWLIFLSVSLDSGGDAFQDGAGSCVWGGGHAAEPAGDRRESYGGR